MRCSYSTRCNCSASTRFLVLYLDLMASLEFEGEPFGSECFLRNRRELKCDLEDSESVRSDMENEKLKIIGANRFRKEDRLELGLGSRDYSEALGGQMQLRLEALLSWSYNQTEPREQKDNHIPKVKSSKWLEPL